MVFFSCEDPIEIEIESGEKQLSVDAFLDNLSQKQTIKLLMSKDFFGDAPQQAVTGAIVKVTGSDGKVYSFLDNGNGEYTWNDSILVHEGIKYALEIQYNGQVYTSSSTANPVPIIDSIVFEPAEGGFGPPDENADPGFTAFFYANDIAGRTDYYRTKTIRNDTLDIRKNNINVSIDGAFGNGNDGLQFIFPIRVGINNGERPYLSGEKLKVQLLSINEEVHSFFTQVSSQINNGGLFAVPPSNVRTNIKSSSTEISKKAIGMFSVSMVSELEVVVP